MAKEVETLFSQLAAQLRQPTESGMKQAASTYQALKDRIADLPDSEKKRQLQQNLLQHYKRLCSQKLQLQKQDKGKFQERALTLMQGIEHAIQAGNVTVATEDYAALSGLLRQSQVTLPGMTEVKLAHLEQQLSSKAGTRNALRSGWQAFNQSRQQAYGAWKYHNLSAAQTAYQCALAQYAALPREDAWKRMIAQTELQELAAVLKHGRNAYATLAEAQFLVDNALSHMAADPEAAKEFYIQGLAAMNTLPMITLDMHPELLEQLNRAYSQLLMQEVDHHPQRSSALKLAKSLATMHDHAWSRNFLWISEEYARACTYANALAKKPRKMTRELGKMQQVVSLYAALPRCTAVQTTRAVMRSCTMLTHRYPEDTQIFNHLAALARAHHLIANEAQNQKNIRRGISAGEP